MKTGDKVEIRKAGPGYDILLGTGKVESVGNRITLTNGSIWRLDGYEWGSKPTRGIGRAHERRIVAMTVSRTDSQPKGEG